jgi:hypothetical protein
MFPRPCKLYFATVYVGFFFDEIGNAKFVEHFGTPRHDV